MSNQSTPTEKSCSKCKEIKPLDDFHKSIRVKSGYRNRCKTCTAIDNKEYSKNNPDKVKDSKKKHYDKKCNDPIHGAGYRKIIANRAAKYRQDNPDYLINYNSLTKAKEQKSKYKKNNPDKTNADAAKRRAAKLRRTVVWADKSKIQEFYTKAQRLTKLYGLTYHVDHIVPLQGKNVSGLHVHNNLQVITASENASKGNKFISG